MGMAGAAPSPCWAAFTTRAQDNGVPKGRVRCNFCGGEMTRNGVEEDRLVETLGFGDVESDIDAYCEREDIPLIRLNFFLLTAPPSANLV